MPRLPERKILVGSTQSWRRPAAKDEDSFTFIMASYCCYCSLFAGRHCSGIARRQTARISWVCKGKSVQFKETSSRREHELTRAAGLQGSQLREWPNSNSYAKLCQLQMSKSSNMTSSPPAPPSLLELPLRMRLHLPAYRNRQAPSPRSSLYASCIPIPR